MQILIRWRDCIAVSCLVCLAASSALAQTPSTGPTRIKIAAGTLSADDTRAGLLGVWEPDADFGLPAGSNHTIYLADGLYINPFRNVALIAFWSATADGLTSIPFDIRQLASGAPSPELKGVFKQISWDQPTVTQITWLTPDRFQDKSRQEAQRRAKPVHDIVAVHSAAVMDLLRGTWTRPGGATVIFEADGTFREMAGAQTAAGTYDFDARAGLLRRTGSAAETASRATRILQSASRSPSRLRWTNRDRVMVDDEPWIRQPVGRGWLGVALAPSLSVVQVQAGSPAERAGLRAGDRIEALNGRRIERRDDFVRDVQALAPGSEAVLTIVRDGARIEQRVTIGRLPE